MKFWLPGLGHILVSYVTWYVDQVGFQLRPSDMISRKLTFMLGMLGPDTPGALGAVPLALILSLAGLGLSPVTWGGSFFLWGWMPMGLKTFLELLGICRLQSFTWFPQLKKAILACSINIRLSSNEPTQYLDDWSRRSCRYHKQPVS